MVLNVHLLASCCQWAPMSEATILQSVGTKGNRDTQRHNPNRVSANLTDAEASNPSKLLHVGEAAAFLAVSKRTLQQLTKDRLVAVVTFGRNVRYDPGDLRRFAESRKIREIGWKAASKKPAAAIA